MSNVHARLRRSAERLIKFLDTPDFPLFLLQNELRVMRVLSSAVRDLDPVEWDRLEEMYVAIAQAGEAELDELLGPEAVLQLHQMFGETKQ